MKHLIQFFSNYRVHISAINAGIWLSALDWSLKIFFGLPTAIYLTLKIYHEFIKPPKTNHHENDPL
jgi:hypothetical protein